MLHPPTRIRERVLCIGPWGAGKSTAWGMTWQWLQRTKSDAKMFVIDTDMNAARVAPDLPEENVADVWSYNEHIEAITRFRKVGTKNDWLVVDLADRSWQAAQDHYIEEAFGKNAATYFLDWKKNAAGKGGSALSDAFGSNWQVINRLYNEFIFGVIRWPGHIIACAPAEPVTLPDRKGEGGDDKDVLDAFGRYGVKPAGQKRLGFQFPTVLLMNPKGQEQWAFSSMKDVGLGEAKRERPQNKPLKDFVVQYLMEVAGWTV